MPDPHALVMFVAAGLLLNITPGPDVLYIVGRSLSQGRAAGVTSAQPSGLVGHAFSAFLRMNPIHREDSRSPTTTGHESVADFLDEPWQQLRPHVPRGPGVHP